MLYDQVLGRGAYGKVFRARCGQLPCAAKVLHSVLFQHHDPGERDIVERFEGECQFLSAVRHPNIVQYLGTITDETSTRPILLMELMDGNLTKLLERAKSSSKSVPYCTQISVCYDVSLALSYLHSCGITHRDLSSNNVLLSGSRAKVADFGVSTVIDKNLSHLSRCPGSEVYMPPEALVGTPTSYTSKLDCFSFGVLAIQMATTNFPSPRPPFDDMTISSEGSSRQLQLVPEVERRKADIDLIDPDHPLLKIALRCIKDECQERPTANDLCDKLAAMREDPAFDSRLCHEEGSLQHLAAFPRSEEGVKRISLRRIKDWTYQPSPEPFSSNDSIAVFDGDKAYFVKRTKLYLYASNSNGVGVWSRLIDTYYSYSGLAVINGKLTTVTGWNRVAFPRALYTLDSSNAWKKELPDLPTGRSSPACVTTSSHLVVIGGFDTIAYRVTCAVEVLNLQSRQWSTATNIPALSGPQCIHIGDSLYLSSYNSGDDLYSCKIEDLLHSPNKTASKKRITSSLWTKLQSILTHSKSAITSCQGRLLAVGGECESGEDSNCVYQYDRGSNWWFKLGEVPTARKLALAGVLLGNRLMCVGGQCRLSSELKVVETGVVVVSVLASRQTM